MSTSKMPSRLPTMDSDEMVECTNWLKSDRENRRLVLVSPMCYRGKSHPGDDKRLEVVEYFVSSWTLDDYLEAVQDDELLASVQPRLDVCTPLLVSVTEPNHHQQQLQ